jgi:hypothetical protein
MVLQASSDDSVRQVLNKRGRSGYGMSAFVFMRLVQDSLAESKMACFCQRQKILNEL